MAIKLQKNEGIKLSKDNQGLKKITLGVGWDPSNGYITEERQVTKKSGFLGLGKPKVVTETVKKPIGNIDIDSTVLVYEGDRCVAECSYRNGSVYNNGKRILKHSGDDTTGGSNSKGDDERIELFLSNVTNQKSEFYLVLNIFNAKSKGQTFDMIKNAYVKVYDDNNHEMASFNLSDNYEGKTGAIVGKVINNGEGYEFIALGDGVETSGIDHLKTLSKRY